MKKNPAPTRRAVQIEVRWGSDVLTVKHFDPPRDVFVGEAGFEGNGNAASGNRLPLVSVGEDGIVSVVYAEGTTGRKRVDGTWGMVGVGEAAARTVVLQEGDCAEVSLGDVTFSISLVRLEAPKRSRLRSRTAVAALSMAASSAALLALLFASRPVEESAFGQEVTDEQFALMQYYLAAAAERELDFKEADAVSEDRPDDREGGAGTRAKGEEGSLGHPRGTGQSPRYGIAGPEGDPSRSAAMRDSAQFGMIGLLNTGAGGDPNAPTISGGRGEGIGLGSIGTIGHGAGTGSGLGFGAGHGRLGGSHHAGPTGSPAFATTDAHTSLAPIDPNGRFATTYRPGKGHLSAFESAIARGAIPAASREMVSDIGSRYAPEFGVDPGKALGFRADLERGKLSPTGGPFHLRFAIRSAPEANTGRPHLSVHLVLDVSGSMQGEPLARAKQAAQHLASRLHPQDDFSLVTFSSEAKVQVSSGPVGPRRSTIERTIERVATEGGTNIGAGLQLAYQQARSPQPQDAIRVVLLVSDGQANEGITDRSILSSFALEAFQSGVQTSTFGVGSSYDGQLMSDVASDGSGGYYYLKDASGIGPALSMELDQRLSPVATAVEVRVRLREDVDLLRVYGSRRLTDVESVRVRAAEVAADQQTEKRDRIKADRQSDLAGGMRFFIPAFAADDSCSILLKLRAPSGVSDRSVAVVEVKYKDRVGMRNVTHEVPISVGYANSAEESARTEDGSVVRTVQGYLAGEALLAAAGALSGGDRVRAASLLEEREQILRTAAGQLGEPAFLEDATRLARLRAQIAGGTTLEPLALATLLEAAGRNHFQ
jgi:Mg-chelatase subunit ChlD